MSAIDQYVAELASSLHVGNRERVRILAEVRDHLDDATAFHEQAGEHHERASAQALREFGRASLIATQFNAAAGSRAMRRAPIVALAAGAAVFAGLVVAGRSQPRVAVPMSAGLPTQVTFFAAVLAFQIAVVAGICAASRALALWRTPSAHGDDRQFVRRAATISAAALCGAAAGWAITLGLAVNRLAHPNVATALGGGAIMIGAATLALTVTHRLRVNPEANARDAEMEIRHLFGLGERGIAVVRRHPIVSGTAVALLSVWPAMAHAEGTFVGAIPWGVTQAATVVVAFVVLGPRLGLRGPRASTVASRSATAEIPYTS